MKTARALYHLLRADFQERIRRYSFLMVLVVTILLGYSMVPSLDDPYNALAIGNYRPYYNSAWIGTVFGVLVATMLTFFGFFLVQDAVPRDYQTRVGQILAATPMSKPLYVLGKWLSNLAVFSTTLAVLTAVALGMQLLRGEDVRIDLWALAAPIWFMGFPTLAMVGSLSVLFESMKLPKLLGNVTFLFLWGLFLLISAGPIIAGHGDVKPGNDIVGISNTMRDIREVMISQGYDPATGATDLYQPTQGRPTIRFEWDGVSWNLSILRQRFLYFLIALGIAVAAALPFDRFDPARRPFGASRKKKRRGKERQSEPDRDHLEEEESCVPMEMIPLDSLKQKYMAWRFLSLVHGELILMLKGRPLWWYGTAVGLFIACLVTPPGGMIVALAWLWPTLLWSGMGCSEITFGTSPLVFSSAHVLRRQLPALLFSGVMVTLVFTGGSAIRLMTSGEGSMLFRWLAGILFVPSLAMALGVWTNSGRVFEIVYFVFWFLGIWNKFPLFDFLGRSDRYVHHIQFYYLILTGVLILFACLGRRKQISFSLG